MIMSVLLLDFFSCSHARLMVHLGVEFCELRSLRIQTQNSHGTGCTLASCIAAELARGSQMLPAVRVINFLFLKQGGNRV